MSLLIPSKITTQEFLQTYVSHSVTSEYFRIYPFRIAFWWFCLFLAMIFNGIGQALQGRLYEKSQDMEGSEDWRKTLTIKCRIISDSVYGLALGLCAYSLTDYAIGGMDDIIIALSYFLLTFFLVGMFWMELYRAYAMVPFFNSILTSTNLILTFFVTLIPFSLRLAMDSDAAVANIGMTLFPLNMVATGITSSAFIALSLNWKTIQIPKEDIMELQRFAVAIPVLALVFIISFSIPSDASIPLQYAQFIPPPLNILKALPFRVAIWWFSFIPMIVIMGTIEVIQEKIIQRRKI